MPHQKAWLISHVSPINTPIDVKFSMDREHPGQSHGSDPRYSEQIRPGTKPVRFFRTVDEPTSVETRRKS